MSSKKFPISKPCACDEGTLDKKVLKELLEVLEFRPKSTRTAIFLLIPIIPIVGTIWLLALFFPDSKVKSYIGVPVGMGLGVVATRLVPMVALGCNSCKRLVACEFAREVPPDWYARTEPQPNCPKCKYDIQGLESPRCPECGQELPQSWIAAVEAKVSQ